MPSTPSLGLAILADGMGGYNGGEVASGMAIALLQASFGRWLAHAGPRAHDACGSNVRCRPAWTRPTTRSLKPVLQICNSRAWGQPLFVAAFATRIVVIVGHIGDSRCYRLRAGKLEQLTRDHSLLQEQMDAGAITAAQAALSPHRNLVTRALGIERHVDLEMHEHERATQAISTCYVRTG